MSTTKKSSATTAARFRMNWRSPGLARQPERACRPPKPSGSAAVSRRRVSLAMVDPWIDERVADVDKQIDHHVDRGDEQDDALNHRDVLREDAADRERSDA